jgi:hypothetical protein
MAIDIIPDTSGCVSSYRTPLWPRRRKSRVTTIHKDPSQWGESKLNAFNVKVIFVLMLANV